MAASGNQGVIALSGGIETARHATGVRSDEDLRMEGLGSRVVLAWVPIDSGRLLVQSVEAGGAGALGPPRDIAAANVRLRFAESSSQCELRMASIRDAVAITHCADGPNGQLTLFDPFTEAVTTVDVSRPTSALATGVTGVDKYGLVGVCYQTGRGDEPGTPRETRFRMFRADGTPFGSSVRVNDAPSDVRWCDVAYYDGAFIVVWIQDERLWGRIVRPRIEP